MKISNIFKYFGGFLLLLVIGFFLYLILPSPTIFAGDSNLIIPPDSPIKLVTNRENKGKRCESNIVYTSKKNKEYHENEGYQFIVDDYCANLQKDLLNAISDENLEEIKVLISQGANPETADWSSFEPIFPLKIAAYKNLNVVKILLDNGADVNQEFCCCASCGTALTEAIDKNAVETVQLLLERGANPNYLPKFSDGAKYKPIDIAVRMGNVEIIQLLENACGKSIQCRAESRLKRLWFLFGGK